jgi:hypothetical protein
VGPTDLFACLRNVYTNFFTAVRIFIRVKTTSIDAYLSGTFLLPYICIHLKTISIDAYSLCTTLKDVLKDVLGGYQVQHLLSEYGHRCGQVHAKLSESGY